MNSLKFGVQYVTGGYKNYNVCTTTNKYASREDAKKEVEELRKMGFAAMAYNLNLGGFEYRESFDSDAERKEYWDKYINPLIFK